MTTTEYHLGGDWSNLEYRRSKPCFFWRSGLEAYSCAHVALIDYTYTTHMCVCAYVWIFIGNSKKEFDYYLHMVAVTVSRDFYLFTFSLIHSVEQSPWEANWFSASQEIPRLLWNSKIHYRTHKCPPTFPVLGQINPVHVPQSHFLDIDLNIILPFMLGSSKWSLSLRFHRQNHICTPLLPHTCYMPRPPHSSRLDHTNNIWWAVQVIKLLIM